MTKKVTDVLNIMAERFRLAGDQTDRTFICRDEWESVVAELLSAHEPSVRLETDAEVAAGLVVKNPAYPPPPKDGPAPDMRRYTEPKTDPIVQWLVENVDDRDVPDDEGNADALLFNLVQLARHGRPYEKYEYKPEQDEEVARLRSSVNRQEPAPPCEHLRSEFLAEKQSGDEPIFQMRKCFDCKKIFRVRSSLNRKGDE